ncbi:MAG: GntR family transcriptional regulator [Pseudomonadales bacterium]|jgi:GntR family transcriptional regulator|nr:GntR family transcriptional regulator [Pseudomonadales bacterium]MDB3908949.1 GntR family transcriptional regulator [Gammaproteobacteria bacterium]
MNITINTKDGVPIYRQIANQIRYMVASKLLQPGEEITAVRTLALALNVTPNTVVKAYDELESSGVIFKRRGAGTYISDEQSPLAERERRRIIAARIDTLLAEAHQLDFNADDLLDLIKERQLQLGKKKQTQNKESEKIDE